MEVSGSLANASDEEGVTGAFAGTAVSTPGVWYEFNADSDYRFASTCNTPASISGFADPVGDTKLHVFVYNDEGELEPIVGNDDACGLMSSVAFLAETDRTTTSTYLSSLHLVPVQILARHHVRFVMTSHE